MLKKLPQASVSDKRTHQVQQSTEKQNGRLPRVLIVDDEKTNLQCLGRFLKKNWETQIATSAEQASKLIAVQVFEAIITDFNMPGHDGIWLLHRVKAHNPKIKRVIHTGSDPVELREHLRSGLIQRYIPKPSSQEVILSSLS